MCSLVDLRLLVVKILALQHPYHETLGCKKALNALIKNRNEVICVNNTDKNLGLISADKEDVVTECHRQLYDIITYNKILWEEAKKLIDKKNPQSYRTVKEKRWTWQGGAMVAHLSCNNGYVWFDSDSCQILVSDSCHTRII